MTLGQEFNAFAETLAGEVRALEVVQRVLCEINMGATAIGTGLNAPAGYAEKCTEHLAKITGFPIHLAEDLIEATQDTQSYVLYSSCMKSLAIKLSKVCNDLRLLSSGPRCGLREINLPAKQPGSSIMPGKVNPVIPEVVNMVCFRVIGSDLTVSMAAEGGQLQLNVFEPVIAACIFEAQTLFINAARTLRVHCVDGITANPEIARHYVDYSHRDGHRAQPGHRLRQGDRARGRGAEDRPRHPGADPREEDPDGEADREGPRSRRHDGAGASRMIRAAARLAVLAAAIAGMALSAAAQKPPDPDGWRSFKATWTLSGTRQLLPTEGARSAAILHLTGPLAVTSGEGLGRGFLSEVFGFDDGGTLIIGRAVLTDQRGDRIYCSIRAEPIDTGRKATGTITGGTGRFAGLEGSFEFAWQYVVDAEPGEVGGRIENIEGRSRLVPPSKREAPR